MTMGNTWTRWRQVETLPFDNIDEKHIAYEMEFSSWTWIWHDER